MDIAKAIETDSRPLIAGEHFNTTQNLRMLSSSDLIYVIYTKNEDFQLLDIKLLGTASKS